MPKHPAVCMVFTDEEIGTMREFFRALAKTKSVALATFVGFLVLGFLGIVVLGIVSWIGKHLGG
jgi:hypothetical protein